MANRERACVQPKPKGGLSRVSTPSLIPLTPRPSADVSEPQNDSVAQPNRTSPPTNTASGTNISNSYTTNNPNTPISFSPEIAQTRSSAGTNSISLQKTTTQTHIKPKFVHKTGLLRTTDNDSSPNTQVPQTNIPFPPSQQSVPSTPNTVDVPNGMKSFNPVSPFPSSGANGNLAVLLLSQGDKPMRVHNK